MPTTITTIERHYCPFEAAYFVRLLIGPEFGNLYSVMADQRRGKKTCLPVIPHYGPESKPHYLYSDLQEFVTAVRTGAKTRRKAQAKVLPVYTVVDLEEEMMLP